MAKPLNEQNIIDRVESETREETEAPIGSAYNKEGKAPATKNPRIVHTASGVANESKGYYGTTGNPGTE